MDPLDAAYDTSSIMHYGKYAFNKNGRPTIEVIGHPHSPIGQRNGFSKTDIEQLNALYDCSNPGTSFVNGISREIEHKYVTVSNITINNVNSTIDNCVTCHACQQTVTRTPAHVLDKTF